MRTFLASAALVLSTIACGSRAVSVETAPNTSARVSLTVNNKLSQPVNVYVVSGSSEIFVKQVASNSTEELSVAGVASGATVQLKARTVDGSKTYTKDSFVLRDQNSWDVP